MSSIESKRSATKLSFFGGVFLWMFAVGEASAFKIDTHIWISQQVLNDAQDGKLTFIVDGKAVEIPIDVTIADSLRDYPSYYRMGNIGPDAGPDVIAGQMTTHPGVPDESSFPTISPWKTTDWLNHVKRKSDQGSPRDRAYMYGYLGHAASDVFAHTYVNQYAGDIFSLGDGETLVEARHFALEAFIGKYTPKLRDQNGNFVADFHKSVDIPAEQIRDMLIYDNDVQSQYLKQRATLHLAGFYALRKQVEHLRDDNVWVEMDRIIGKAVIEYWAGIELTDDQIDAVNNAATRWQQDVMRGVDVVQEWELEIQRIAERAINSDYDAIKKQLQAITDLHQKLSAAKSDLESTLLKIAKKSEEYRKEKDVLDDIACKKDLLGNYHPHGCRELLRTQRMLVDAILDQLNGLKNERDRLENSINNTLKKNLEDAVDSLRDTTIAVLQAAKATDHALIELQQRAQGDVNAIRSELTTWIHDIDFAMTNYVEAWGQLMINTLDPTKAYSEPVDVNGPSVTYPDPTVFGPLFDWWKCDMPLLIKIPLGLTACGPVISYQNLLDKVQDLNRNLNGLHPIGAQLNKVNDMINNKLNAELTRAKSKLGEKIVDKLLPDDLRTLVKIMRDGLDENGLNKMFTQQEVSSYGNKGLIMIPDIATRVKADMNVLSAGTFDPNKFAPAYNAVVFAKLALLNKYQMQELATATGVSVSLAEVGENVVAESLKSIDGNHQWLDKRPSYPRVAGRAEKREEIEKDSEKRNYRSAKGMWFWENKEARDKLFRKIFIGPLSAGIDAPEIHKMTEILTSDYDYDVCAAHAYPNGIEDKSCTFINIFPAILIISH